MRFAYIATDQAFDTVARTIRTTALPDHGLEERDGLNLGGGQYFRIYRQRDEIMVCRASYGDRPSGRFSYCLYVHNDESPNESRIEPIVAALQAAGMDVELDPAERS